MKTGNSPHYCKKCSMPFRSLSLYDKRCAYCSWSPKSRWTNDPAPLLGGTSQNGVTGGTNDVQLMSDFGRRKNYRPEGTPRTIPPSFAQPTPITVNIGGMIIKYLVEKDKSGLVARLLEISHEAGAIDWAEYRTRKKAQNISARIRRDFDKAVGLYLRDVNDYIKEQQKTKILL